MASSIDQTNIPAQRENLARGPERISTRRLSGVLLMPSPAELLCSQEGGVDGDYEDLARDHEIISNRRTNNGVLLMPSPEELEHIQEDGVSLEENGEEETRNHKKQITNSC